MNNDIQQDLDCAVCLLKCHHPTKLPCGHIFCFLCVKGIAIQSRKCAMCRAEIPTDYLDNPVILEDNAANDTDIQDPSNEYQWYYEGRNGWWKYDERSNCELETAHVNGDNECKLLLAGALYCINFQKMLQFKCNDPTRRRHVKRDTPALPAKGIAGIKITDSSLVVEEIKTDESSSEVEVPDSGILELLEDNSTPSYNVSNNIEDLFDIVNTLRSLHLPEESGGDEVSDS